MLPSSDHLSFAILRGVHVAALRLFWCYTLGVLRWQVAHAAGLTPVAAYTKSRSLPRGGVDSASVQQLIFRLLRVLIPCLCFFPGGVWGTLGAGNGIAM
jgi:hypothetical protein